MGMGKLAVGRICSGSNSQDDRSDLAENLVACKVNRVTARRVIITYLSSSRRICRRTHRVVYYVKKTPI